MDESPISIRIILFTVIFSLGIFGWLVVKNNLDTRTKIVFCDVGQGDGTYIRIRNKIDVVIDAGPDNSILQCLGQHMPFFDRTVELAFITHPQKDHYFGFIEIGKRYKIETIFMNPLNSKNESFQELLKILATKNSQINFPHEETRIESRGAVFDFLWPSEAFIEANLSKHENIFHYEGKISQNKTQLSSYMGESVLDPNLFSLVFTFEQDSNRILFTGDATQEVLTNIGEKHTIKTDILKVPHHGSKNGLNVTFFQLADPGVSVISVGKNNRYGHPSPEVIDIFKTLNKKYLTTMKEGSIVFKIDRGRLVIVK